MTTHWLFSDTILWLLVTTAVIAILMGLRREPTRAMWRHLFQNRLAMASMVILTVFLSIALLDSWHGYSTHPSHTHQRISLLDTLLPELTQEAETTYSAPFATHLYQPSLTHHNTGKQTLTYQPLTHISTHAPAVWTLMVSGAGIGTAITLAILAAYCLIRCLITRCKPRALLIHAMLNRQNQTWPTVITTLWCVLMVISAFIHTANYYHVFGTDQVGHDVFSETIKSIRTGMLIGIFSTVFMLPLAIIFGLLAGYCRGWVDDVIQYCYTTLSAIPGVLLISATLLVMQVYLQQHPHWFSSLTERADARLITLCFVLGLTSWANLCRLIRAETLKIKSLDYIAAAKVLGLSPIRILRRHIFPNLMHIVLITIALDFSGLVLAEAVLSYVGVGVDPTTASWGNMINSSRLEMAREPLVWWPLIAAFIFMFLLVLSANLFADALRDALDPRIRNQARS